ncbi:AbiV family abortive infection protein [Burkholderia seminalis]|uniref:AbiV family abortive infection protein n=1 Tax=Burkholderia seminalis TaxID=488731 RepID=UPI001CF3DD05|nr:AbiV family abortive infection protein [Burkholderia seminalis]MCA8425836.1 AbiV family abortive infection protein [Burkholderia seminalis]
MKTLSIDDLHALRLAIYDNAEDLHREADLLLQHSMFSRAYLLAHFCIEELGKIPIIVNVVGSLVRGESVDWKQANRRFSSHVEKIASQNGHSYAFGAKLDTGGNSDVQSLVTANQAVQNSYEKKNLSTYVDARGGKIFRPSETIAQEDAVRLVASACECLRVHRRSESLTNPLIYEAIDSGAAQDGTYWNERERSRRRFSE